MSVIRHQSFHLSFDSVQVNPEDNKAGGDGLIGLGKHLPNALLT